MCDFMFPPRCKGDIHSTAFYNLYFPYFPFSFFFSFTSATPFLHLAMALPLSTPTLPPPKQLKSLLLLTHPSRSTNPIG